MSRLSRNKTLSLGALLGAAGIAVVAFAWPSSAGPNVGPVENAFENAMIAHQQIGATGASSGQATKVAARSLTTGRFSFSSKPTLRHLSRPQITHTNLATSHRLASVFSGAQLAREKTVQRHLIASYSKLTPTPAEASTDVPDYVVNGGATNFKFTSIAITGKTATLTAKLTSWLNYASVGTNATTLQTPSNDIIATAHLVQGPNSSWTVDQYSWTFAPGSEP